MPAFLTKKQIWNMALDHLREEPVSDVTDQTAGALWLARNYDHQRDYLLARYFWKFAMRRDDLAADTVAPAWGWSYRYRLPSDYIRLVPPEVNGKPITFEEEGGFLLCNIEGPLRLRGVIRLETHAQLSNDFAELLSLRLAMKMAHFLTGKQSYMEALKQMYQETLQEVRETGALQVAAGSYYDTDILDNIFS